MPHELAEISCPSPYSANRVELIISHSHSWVLVRIMWITKPFLAVHSNMREFE